MRLGLGLSLALLCPQHRSPQSLAQKGPQNMLLNGKVVCLLPLSLPTCVALAQPLDFTASGVLFIWASTGVKKVPASATDWLSRADPRTITG